MRVVIAILLASVFLFQSASKLLVLANYEINKEYISKNLCENKEKPKSTCNGKCHLAKELNKQDKNENSVPVSQKEKFEVQYFSEFLFDQTINVSDMENRNVFSYTMIHYLNFLDPIFQPPRAV
ncbi:MAG: hypothetical protein IT215_01285 [Chitinophagaceae bacterium]|nr:hypothetical protein [Chitinophagaceae bacterium]